jgi:RNAse (barnase) inhibitor barstar
MPSVVLATETINDFPTFHAECTRAFGFPDFYGQNMDAWIDCLSYLTQGDGMSAFTLGPDELLFIHLPDFEAFSQRVPGVSAAMLECAAFVNCRYVEAADRPRLVLVLR